jgi:biotin carboxyl carrier protein
MPTRNVKSPTGGVVSVVHKSVGESVELDEPIVTVECMKMEIPIAASGAGRLVQIRVTVGNAVSEDQVIAVIES